MVLQPLEDKAKQQAFLEERRSRKEEKSSGGFWHESYEPQGRRPMEHLRQGREGVSREKRMREIFRTRNTYGEISLGMNQKGETMLVADREHNLNGPTVERNQKQIDEANAYYWRGKAGNRMTNIKEPVKSAFALNSTHQHDGENRHRGDTLLLQSQIFAQQTGQHTAMSSFPEKSIRAGTTKSRSAREMKLMHQLELALRMGEKQIRGRDEGSWQGFMSKVGQRPEEDMPRRGVAAGKGQEGPEDPDAGEEPDQQGMPS
ncbi:MAG: hypothetical protein IJV04_06640 [Lachnospiraceae bacterium]|nr:hypothetical protein [Lachnospiraceae bacterium]